MHQVLPTEILMQLSFSKLSQIVIKILWDIDIDIVAETVKRGKRNNRKKKILIFADGLPSDSTSLLTSSSSDALIIYLTKS